MGRQAKLKELGIPWSPAMVKETKKWRIQSKGLASKMIKAVPAINVSDTNLRIIQAISNQRRD